MADEERAELSRQSFGGTRGRQEERGDVAEPDAPTQAEPNEAMSTILSADQPLGVQDDVADE